jgi:IclR family transcriptional regulator, KDG regulon repressor
MNARPYYRIQSVERAMHILKAFIPEHSEWGVTELSRHMELSKSIVHRLLLTLESEGLVRKNQETGRYSLGLEAFRIGMVFLGRWNLPEDSSRYLRVLSQELDMASHLAVMDEGQVLYVSVVYPPHYVGAEFGWAGRRRPPHHTALGKALLAWLPEASRSPILDGLTYQAITGRTIVDRATLETQLAQVYRQGYALEDQELVEGWRCLAAPIFDHTQQVVAAISVTAPVRRLSDAAIPQVAQRMRTAAMHLSGRLGYDRHG